ncbi:ferredoxin, partial [Roseateles sp. GG27B]
VDCISLVNVTDEQTGWAAWSSPQADAARARYKFHQLRVAREAPENELRLLHKAEAKLAHLAEASLVTDPVELDHKRASIEAALIRARAKRQG